MQIILLFNRSNDFPDKKLSKTQSDYVSSNNQSFFFDWSILPPSASFSINLPTNPLIKSPSLKKSLKKVEDKEEDIHDQFALTSGPYSSKLDSLYDAARYGDFELCNKLISEGFDVNIADENGCTPLHGAASFGRVECVDLLINKGANINQVDKNGNTSLHYACYHHRDETSVELLRRGALSDIPNNEGKLAIELIEIESVKQLIQDEINKALSNNNNSSKSDTTWSSNLDNFFSPLLFGSTQNLNDTKIGSSIDSKLDSKIDSEIDSTNISSRNDLNCPPPIYHMKDFSSKEFDNLLSKNINNSMDETDKKLTENRNNFWFDIHIFVDICLFSLILFVFFKNQSFISVHT